MSSVPDRNIAMKPSAGPVNPPSYDPQETIDAPSRAAGSGAAPAASIPGPSDRSGSSGGEDAAAAAAGDSRFPSIPGYQIIGRLGEGGMGVVWRAVQDGTHRPVALKLMSAANFGSERARLRFQREVDLTARLEHPGIARVYEGGQRGGVCFYAMELVEGVPLDLYVRQQKLDYRQILSLMKSVCEAVQYAHQKGVIHRDLKPDNILVSSDGQPHVLDFGLAKIMSSDPDGSKAVSIDGQVAGTPAFMSPEQAAGKGDRVDTRSDVYSLGVILYRLLTGHSPHDLTGSYLQVLTRVSTEEIRRPREILPKLDWELEAVILKSLAQDPEQRYPSAIGLAQDIGNYLADEPLTAKPPSTAYFLRKRLRKYRGRLAAAACVLLALAAVAVVSYVRVVRAREAAVVARGDAEHQAALAMQSEARAKENEARAVQSEIKARAQQDRADAEARAAKLRLAESRVAEADAFAGALRFDAAESGYREAQQLFRTLGVPTAPADWGLWDAYRRLPPPLVNFGKVNALGANIAFSPDGATLFTGGAGGTFFIFDVRTGLRLRHRNCGPGELHSLDVTPNGRLLTVTDAGTLKLFDPSSGRFVRTIEVPEDTPPPGDAPEKVDVPLVAAVPGGRAITAWGSSLRLWELVAGTLSRSWDVGADIIFLSVSRDGRLALLGTHPLGSATTGAVAIRIWDLDAGNLVRALRPTGPVMLAGAFSPDGRYAAAAGNEGSAKILDVATGQIVSTLTGHRLPVRSLTWSRDGSSLFTASGDGTVREWEAATGRQTRLIVADDFPVRQLCLSPDGQLLVSLENDGTIQGWSLADGREERPLPSSNTMVRDVHVSPDGMTALSAANGFVILSDIATGKTLRVLDVRPHRGTKAYFLTGGREALSVGGDGHLQVWDLQTGKNIRSFDAAAPASSAAISPDGSRLAIAGNGQVDIWDLAAGKRLGFGTLSDGGAINSIVFAPDGQSFVTVGSDIWQWETASIRPRRKFDNAPKNTICAAFDPRGQRLATNGAEFDLWDAASGELLQSSKNLTAGQVNAIAFSPDGTQLLLGGGDGDLRLVDASNPSRVRSIPTDEARITTLAYGPNGAIALTGHPSGDVKVWDFARLGAYQTFEQDLPESAEALGDDPADNASLAALGRWYLFRGRYDWAADLLTKARSHGAQVSSLDLGRCKWQTGDLAGARTEFQAALAAREASESYLNLCLSVLPAPASKPATVLSSRKPSSRSE